MVPSLFSTTQLSSNRLMRSIEEAKNDAAEFVLMQIYSNPQLQLQHLQQPQVQSDETKIEQSTVLNNGYPTTSTNDSKSTTSTQQSTPVLQQVINPATNGQYPDHLNEYQQIIPAQQYIIDPTGNKFNLITNNINN